MTTKLFSQKLKAGHPGRGMSYKIFKTLKANFSQISSENGCSDSLLAKTLMKTNDEGEKANFSQISSENGCLDSLLAKTLMATNDEGEERPY